MIVSILSLKGGVGKSTIAQNIAVTFAHKGYSVCIADVDTNQSCLRWSEYRNEDLPTVQVFGFPNGQGLTKNVKKLNQQFDFVIIDGTPSLSNTASKIIMLADMLIIPMLCGVMDIWATEKFLERYEEAKEQKEENIPAYFLLNQFNSRLTISKETKEILENVEDVKTLTVTIGNRVAYKEANIKGLGVYELNEKKAKIEMIELSNEIENEIEILLKNK